MIRFDSAPANPLYPALIENSLDLITVVDDREHYYLPQPIG